MRKFRTVAVVVWLVLACSSDPEKPEPGLDAADAARTGEVAGDAVAGDAGRLPVDILTDAVDVSADVESLDLPPPCDFFGCPCQVNVDCASGFCVEHMDGKVCSQTCIDECPAGFDCKLTDMFGDPVAICVSRYPRLCRPCKQSLDCESVEGVAGACVTYDMDGQDGLDGAFCGGDCDDATQCPAGFACLDVTTREDAKLKQCVRTDGLCPCGDNAVKMGLSTVCEIANEFGTCSGLRMCSDLGLGDCSADEPSAEECDGVDNDCNGQVDDGAGLDDCCTCGNGVPEVFCGETVELCCPDFSVCGNGKCECGETPCECPQDCCGTCGDGKCIDYKSESGDWCCNEWDACPDDCKASACGNGQCESGENAFTCVQDCGKFVCDNNTCEPGEDVESCPQDCSEFCGNCTCDEGEFFFGCPHDCGWCGDGYCSKCAGMGEWDHENVEWLCLDCCDPAVICQPDGKPPLECGDNGCGGLCGPCEDGLSCTVNSCLAGHCQFVLVDGCLIEGVCLATGTLDPSNPCALCTPALSPNSWSPQADGTVCGDNSVCVEGVCACADNQCLEVCCESGEVCLDGDGACCAPDCTGKECGLDGCGGQCGQCAEFEECSDINKCECVVDSLKCNDVCCAPGDKCEDGTGPCCTPQCDGHECGPDGCGHDCGQCPEGIPCYEGQCVYPPNCFVDDHCAFLLAEDGQECLSLVGACDLVSETCIQPQEFPAEFSVDENHCFVEVVAAKELGTGKFVCIDQGVSHPPIADGDISCLKCYPQKNQYMWLPGFANGTEHCFIDLLGDPLTADQPLPVSWKNFPWETGECVPAALPPPGCEAGNWQHPDGIPSAECWACDPDQALFSWAPAPTWDVPWDPCDPNKCGDPHFLAPLANGDIESSLAAPYAGSDYGRCAEGTCWGLSLQVDGFGGGGRIHEFELNGEPAVFVGTIGGPLSGGFAHYVYP